MLFSSWAEFDPSSVTKLFRGPSFHVKLITSTRCLVNNIKPQYVGGKREMLQRGVRRDTKLGLSRIRVDNPKVLSGRSAHGQRFKT